MVLGCTPDLQVDPSQCDVNHLKAQTLTIVQLQMDIDIDRVWSLIIFSHAHTHKNTHLSHLVYVRSVTSVWISKKPEEVKPSIIPPPPPPPRDARGSTLFVFTVAAKVEPKPSPCPGLWIERAADASACRARGSTSRRRVCIVNGAAGGNWG